MPDALRPTVDRRLRQPTTSKHPYRPFAAAEAAADRHRVASTAARLLWGYYEATTRATATRLLQGYYEAASYQATTRLLPGHYQATTRLLPGYYQESRARHLASSTAAAAQLVCRRRSIQQLGAGADDPHTARKISRRPFTTCRYLSIYPGGAQRFRFY